MADILRKNSKCVIKLFYNLESLKTAEENFNSQSLLFTEDEIANNDEYLVDKEIADKLFISTHTVMSHRKNMTEKLGIKSISGLTVYAIINNYIDTTNLNIKDLI